MVDDEKILEFKLKNTRNLIENHLILLEKEIFQAL